MSASETSTRPMIEVEDLTVDFGSGASHLRAVDRIGFTVGDGEVFGLVGESGCGKSTVLRALAGLNDDWSGRVAIDGMAMAANRERAFYKKVQMVFQDPYGSLHPRMTVNDILMEPIIVHRLEDANDRINKVLDEVGLGPDFRFRYPHQLSGGQRQRVAVARCLILQPKVLLLDEPTSALDVSVQAEILNLLADLRREEGLTYILVSHDLGVVAHLCDRLAVMNLGRILETMSVTDLTQNRPADPYTKRLFAASLGYGRTSDAA